MNPLNHNKQICVDSATLYVIINTQFARHLFNWKHFLCANSIRVSRVQRVIQEFWNPFFQILLDKQLLLECNHSMVFFLGNITTSHHIKDAHTSSSLLFGESTQELLSVSYLFLKFWTQIEEYFLKNIVFASWKLPPPPMTPGLML